MSGNALKDFLGQAVFSQAGQACRAGQWLIRSA
jgi:hypothetical protein